MRMCKQQGRVSRPVHALTGLAVALFLAFGGANNAAAESATPFPLASAPFPLAPASVLPLHVGGLFGAASSDESPAPATTTASDLRPAAEPRVEQPVINPLEALSSYVPVPGEWRQVPGLQFNRFGLTDQEATALNIRGTGGSAAVLSQQTGSAYDPEGFLWYFWGGGGGSYGGNEVYRLDLTFPLISQITQPSTLDTTVTVPGANNCFAPSDGPAAGSTYDGFVWSPATQSFFVFPTGGFCPGGTYNQQTVWEFDPLAGTWDSIAGMASLTGPVFAEYDPVSGLIYVVEAGANATVREFDPVTGQLGAQNNLGQSLSAGNAVLDSSNDELIVFAQEGVYAVSLVNLGTIRRLADVPSGYDTASGAALNSGRGLVALWAGGKTVHSFNLATNTWTEEIPASGPNPGPGGVFSKWIAIPEFGIFAGYHNPGEGLWLYRLPTSLNVPPPPNRAPVAFAGGAIVTAHTGNAVNLNGSGSTDPDGDALSYAWSTVSSPAGNTPVLSTPNQAATSFTPAVNGGYVLRLTVSDGVLSDTVNVTVTATNAVPVANAGPDQSVQVGQTATLNAGASTDADGDTLSYSWSIAAAPAGSSAALSGAQSVSPSFVPDQAGTYSLSVNVSDGIASAQGAVVVTASVAPPANSAPVANAGPDQSLIEGQTAALTGLASSDPDGDTLSYTWTLTQKPAGSSANLSNTSAAQPSLALDVAGAYVASLTVDDGALTSAADQVTITAQIDLGTAGGPAITALNLIDADTNQTILQLQDGLTIDLAAGRNLNVEALVAGAVESIAFDLSGFPAVVESNPPYALAGDTGGSFNAWTPPVGSYQLTATPYTLDNGGGSAGAAVTVSFTVTDSGGGSTGGNPPPSGPALLAHWEFDENSGALAGDNAGTNEGTVFGATWAAGVAGSALSFGGSDYVVIDNTPELDITGSAITMAAWIKPSDGGDPSGSRVISKRTDAGGCDVYSMFTLSNQFWFRLDCQEVISSSSFQPDGWIHVAMVYDGAVMRTYLNGAQDSATRAKSDAIDSSARPVHLGMREGEGRHFTGLIDDTRIYNRALSATEVADLFNAGGVPANQLATITAGSGGGSGGSTGGGSAGGCGSTGGVATGLGLTVNVSNATELQTALNSAVGGEEILLANGSYGSIVLCKDYADYVTLKSVNPLGATFTDLDIPGGSYIRLDGIKVNGLVRADEGAHHLTYTNSAFYSGTYFFDGNNIVVNSNDIGGNTGIKILVSFDGITDFELKDNYIHHARSDLVRVVAASSFGLIENNFLFDVQPTGDDHPDSIQFFGRAGAGTPHDITIRGNYIYDDPTTGIPEPMQGPFVSDPAGVGYFNILIEQNFIAVHSANSIYINGCLSNCLIQNNTFANEGRIRIVEKSRVSNRGTTIRNNVMRLMSNETTSLSAGLSISNNYIYSKNSSAPNYRGNLYQGNNTGSTWQDFIPKTGSAVDFGSGLGALDRILQLMN